MAISEEEGFGISLGDLVTPQTLFVSNVPDAGQVLSFQKSYGIMDVRLIFNLDIFGIILFS